MDTTYSLPVWVYFILAFLVFFGRLYFLEAAEEAALRAANFFRKRS